MSKLDQLADKSRDRRTDASDQETGGRHRCKGCGGHFDIVDLLNHDCTGGLLGFGGDGGPLHG